MSALLRSTLHDLLGRRMALIEVTGRRTGGTHRLPVNVLPEGEGSMLVLSRPSRRWWRNLRGGADLHVWYEGRPLEAWGEVLDVDVEARERWSVRPIGRAVTRSVPQALATWLKRPC